MKHPHIPLALALALTFTACSDNDLDTNGAGNNGSNTELTDQEYETHQALLRLLSSTAEVDTLPSNWNTTSYTVEPTIGEPIDAANPHVRYLSTNNAEEACRIYKSMIAAASDGTATNDTWSHDGIGTLKFNVLNQADAYATLDVNVQQLPTLEQIRFVPSSAIGDNAVTDPYYSLGDIIRQEKTGEQPTYYVCVRPAGGDKKKSHWCSLQLNGTNMTNPNFIDFTNRGYQHVTVPTATGKPQAENERMVQNYFNVLRLIANPTYYNKDEVTSIGEVSKEKFTTKDLSNLNYMWEDLGVWDNIAPNNTFKDNLAKEKALFRLFYHGYSKNTKFSGPNEYNLYTLAIKTGEFINNQPGEYRNLSPIFKYALPSETRLVPSTKEPKDFSDLNEKGKITFDINDEITGEISNCYVVKYKSGAQLDDRWFSNYDYDPSSSFSNRNTSNKITDVLVQKEMKKINIVSSDDFYPYFAFGDVAIPREQTKPYVCVLEETIKSRDEYVKQNATLNSYVYFISSENIDDTKKLATAQANHASEEIAKQIITRLLDAHIYDLNKNDKVNIPRIIQLSSYMDEYNKAAETLNETLKELNTIHFSTGTDAQNNTYYTASANIFIDESFISSSATKNKVTVNYYPQGKPGNANVKLEFNIQPTTADDKEILLLGKWLDLNTYQETFSKSRTLTTHTAARKALKRSINEAYKQLIKAAQ